MQNTKVHFNYHDIAKIVAFLILLMAIMFSAGLKAQSVEPLILRMGDVSANKFPFILAVDEGIYKRNNINVIPKFSPASVATIRRSGIDVADENIYDPDSGVPYTIAIHGISPLMNSMVHTAGTRHPIILGTTHSVSRWRFITAPNITTAEQLKGKRIGYSGHGNVTHYYIMMFAREMGWDPRFDLSLMDNGLGVDALLDGHIDAMITPELHSVMALANDFSVAVDTSVYKFPVAGSGLVADREWYRNNPEAARAFIKSAVEAIALMKTDKAAAFRAMEKWYNMKNNEDKEIFYAELLKMDSKPYAPLEGIKMVMEIYDSHEMRKYTPDYFYDDSIVRELDESGYIDSLYNNN